MKDGNWMMAEKSVKESGHGLIKVLHYIWLKGLRKFTINLSQDIRAETWTRDLQSIKQGC
jgi:hypothetical protein